MKLLELDEPKKTWLVPDNSAAWAEAGHNEHHAVLPQATAKVMVATTEETDGVVPVVTLIFPQPSPDPAWMVTTGPVPAPAPAAIDGALPPQTICGGNLPELSVPDVKLLALELT